MKLLDILKSVFGLIGRTSPVASPPRDENQAPPTPQPTVPVPVQPPVVTPPVRQGANPDRYGTFIIPDVYPKDLDNPNTPQYELPPFKVLPGMVVSDKEVIGCYIKCSEGVGWGAKNEQWFRDCWPQIKAVGGERYGTDWFRGCYHFLRFDTDGTRQADYCLDLIESAGGFDVGDLMLWVDVEEGGQGAWANDPQTGARRKLESITNVTERRRLAAEIAKVTSDFVARVKARYPGMKVGIYGRGVFRDLRITDARYGADGWCNPAYTEHMPPMEAYGIPLDDVIEWQLCGDGEVYAKGFPSLLPGWGKTDYSVCIYGAHRMSLKDVRRRCLARPRG